MSPSPSKSSSTNGRSRSMRCGPSPTCAARSCAGGRLRAVTECSRSRPPFLRPRATPACRAIAANSSRARAAAGRGSRIRSAIASAGWHAQFASASRRSLFAESIGPLGNPAKALDALAAEAIDVVALDSFYLDLVRRYQPEKLAGIRTIATTPWTPIPLLVAAPSIEASIVERLRAHLVRVHDIPAYAPLLERTLLARFATPDPAAYAALERAAKDAAASGYADIR